MSEYLNMSTTIAEVSRVGKRGTVVIPAKVRRRFNLDEGALLVIEEREDGVLLRPAVVMPTEIYTPQRKAEFLLSNAVDTEDYRQATKEVKVMGLDPGEISHRKPARK